MPYKIERQSKTVSTAEELPAFLNEQEEQGWQLVAITPAYMVFYRDAAQPQQVVTEDAGRIAPWRDRFDDPIKAGDAVSWGNGKKGVVVFNELDGWRVRSDGDSVNPEPHFISLIACHVYITVDYKP